MAHLIENNEMFSVRATPWHKQGIVLDNAPTTREAIRTAKLDWPVIKAQNHVRLIEGEYVANDGHVMTEANTFPTPSFSTVRLDPVQGPIILGTVSDQYSVLQNLEAFEIFDDVLLPAGYTYETAGAIKSGRKVWIMAKSPTRFTVRADDAVAQYLLLVTSHDGTAQLRFFPTAIRVVCNNTLQWALQGAADGFAIPHKGDIKEKLSIAARLVERANGSFVDATNMMQMMNEYAMTEGEVVKYFEAVIPDLVKRNDPALRRNTWRQMFDALANGYYYGRGNRGKTLWDAYNAVTEYVDHTRNTGEHRLVEYSMFGAGSKLKITAFDRAAAIVKKATTPDAVTEDASSVFVGVN